MSKKPTSKVVEAVVSAKGQSTALFHSGSAEIERIYALVGRIALSWNEVDLLWYLILTVLMKDTPREQVDAIFHLFQTGAAQRTMIMAVNGTLPEQDIVRKRIGSLHAKTNDASGDRNAAIHALVMEYPNIALGGTEIRVAPGSHPTKKNKLAGKNVERELQTTLATIQGLMNELEAFLYDVVPKIEVPPEVLEKVSAAGFRLPSFVVPKSEPIAKK
ncbi:hypothetical protein ACO2I3_01070 [Leptospira interrogans]